MRVSDLRELYQSVILDHNRHPRNYATPPESAARGEGRNPLCGDAVTVWVRTDGTRIQEIGFVGEGCAISKASASLMTTVVKGQTAGEALALADRFHGVVTGELPLPETDPALRRLAPLAGVSRYPERVKCATLAWHALRVALAQVATSTPTTEAEARPTPRTGQP
jgi:nitrogen fixation protein NifU and related proteins